jgi:hypothetical protein
MDWLMWMLALMLGFTGAASEPSHDAGTSVAPVVSAETRMARALVEDQVGPDDDIESASYVVGRGMVAQANTGESCTSGRLLTVKVVGTFRSIAVSPGPWGLDEDHGDEVRAVVIRADATTGKPCEIAVQTGDPEPIRGAIDIPLD